VAHSKSALKRWRQNEAHRARNKTVRTAARTAVRGARTAIATPDGDAAAAIREASSILDRAAKRNVIHRNAASRHKSRMMRQANRAGPAAAEAAPAKRTRKAPAKPRATTTRAKAPAKPRAPKAKKD